MSNVRAIGEVIAIGLAGTKAMRDLFIGQVITWEIVSAGFGAIITVINITKGNNYWKAPVVVTSIIIIIIEITIIIIFIITEDIGFIFVAIA